MAEPVTMPSGGDTHADRLRERLLREGQSEPADVLAEANAQLDELTSRIEALSTAVASLEQNVP